MISSANGVQLNGVHSPRTSSIFAGDSIRTLADSPAVIHANGSVIQLAGNTSAKLGKGSVDVQLGSAVIGTKSGLKANTNGISITPAAADSKYEIASQDGKVTVTSRQGDLLLADATGTMTLHEGMSAAIDTSDNDTNGQGGKRKGAAPIPAASGGKGLSHAWLYAAGAAAVAAAVIIAVETRGGSSPSTISPSR